MTRAIPVITLVQAAFPGVTAWPVANGYMIARLSSSVPNPKNPKKPIFIPGITLSRGETLEIAWANALKEVK